MTMTDDDLAEIMKIKTPNLQKLRLSIGCKRSNWKIESPATIALILELYANGNTIVRISKIVDKSVHRINRIIDRCFKPIPRSYNTITLVLDSKINF